MTQSAKIILAILLTAVIVGGGIYFWQNPSEEFESVLYENDYGLPSGTAEIAGYYTTVESPTTLSPDGPTKTCSAFVVMDGPSLLLNSLDGFGSPPTVVIGPEDSYFEGIETSTKENPIKVLASMNSQFEGEVVGCMPWPFESITAVQ